MPVLTEQDQSVLSLFLELHLLLSLVDFLVISNHPPKLVVVFQVLPEQMGMDLVKVYLSAVILD